MYRKFKPEMPQNPVYFQEKLLNFPKLNEGRGLHGCAKIREDSELSFVVAGGTGNNGIYLDSVEILKISDNFVDNFGDLSWEKLGKLNSARTYFPTIGVLNSKVLPDGLTTFSSS